MKRIILLLFLIFTHDAMAAGLSSGGVLNDTGNPSRDGKHTSQPFEQRLETGITAFYRSDWNEARTVFSELKERDVNDLRPYFFEAMIPFWKYFFGGEHPDDALDFLEKSEAAIKVGEEHIETNPDDITTVLMLGGLYGYRALVAAGEQQYRTALRSGANGYSYTRTLMRMDSGNPDALIGQGVFNYMMGTIPGAVRWTANLFGLRGDKETGLELLEWAGQMDTHTSTDARIILTYIYHLEERYEDALRVVDVLVEEWPDNTIFRYYRALSLEMCGKYEEAEAGYRAVIARAHPELMEIRKESNERLDALAKR